MEYKFRLVIPEDSGILKGYVNDKEAQRVEYNEETNKYTFTID
tara:strand:+ start:60 stop:188 length:129 start_codon:yes stop_codon:yes gene_type:complete